MAPSAARSIPAESVRGPASPGARAVETVLRPGAGGPGTTARVLVAPTMLMSSHARVGTVVNGTYRVQSLIAEGGMGSVFEVEHIRLGQRYALKYLDERVAGAEEAVARFRQEAEIAASLHHPAIARVFDFDTDADGAPYMVMEHVEGTTLGAFCNGRQLPLRDIIRIFDRLTGALGTAHRAGVIHRDLKPSNIMVRRDESGELVLKLLDFGISKAHIAGTAMTSDNVVMGTPNYMSPEQACGRTNQVDARTDVFALGVLLYEMLCGQRAFEGDAVPQLLHALLYLEPPPIDTLRPGLPTALNDVLSTCLKKDASERYPGVREFQRALVEAARSRSRRPVAETPGVAVAPKQERSSRMRSIGLLCGWIGSLAVVGSVVFALTPRHAAPDEIAPARPVDPDTATGVAEVQIATTPFESVSVAPTSKMLQVGAALLRADAGGVTVWQDAEARPRTRALPSASQVTALTEGSDGDVVVAQADGTVSRWDRSLLRDGWHRRFGTEPIDAVASGGDYVAVARGDVVELFNAETGRSLKKFSAGGSVVSLLLTPGPRRVLLVVKPREIVALDADARRALANLPLNGRAIRASLGDRATAGEVEVQIDFEQGTWTMRRTFVLTAGRKSDDTKLLETGSSRI